MRCTARMAESIRTPGREETAHRLLRSSVKRSYDPLVDIDWDAPLAGGEFFMPPTLISLYGTPYWDELSHEQRVDLSREMMANSLSVGIWFENILNQMLLRLAYDQDPTRAHVHYALTELADECRHMTMFGKLIGRVGARPYPVSMPLHLFGKTLPLILRGPSVWVAALVGEELFDALQRATMREERLQPVVRQVIRIHVAEEARHIKYAREDLARMMARASWPDRALARVTAGAGVVLLRYLLNRPEMFRRAGLDARRARREARANPHIQATFAHGIEKMRSFLDGQGLIWGPSRLLWHAARLHPDGPRTPPPPSPGDAAAGGSMTGGSMAGGSPGDATTGSDEDPDEYDGYTGPATLVCDEREIPIRAQVAGHVEPYDGTFHWWARLDPDDRVTALHAAGRTSVTLTLPGGTPTPATLAELNPWTGARLTGQGPPP